MTVRYWIFLAVAAAVFALGSLASCQVTAPVIARAKRAAVEAEAQTKTAVATTRAMDGVSVVERTTRRRAESEADDIDSTAGAETPLPPAVLARWRLGIDRMRNGDATEPSDGSR